MVVFTDSCPRTSATTFTEMPLDTMLVAAALLSEWAPRYPLTPALSASSLTASPACLGD